MAESFNPYHKWLGIPRNQLPPNHYRLLGIDPFESDPDVIEAAADQRSAHLRTFRTGKHAEISEKLLADVAAAKVCLLRPEAKAEYDADLKEKMPPAARAPAAKKAGAKKRLLKKAVAAAEGSEFSVVATPAASRAETRTPGKKPNWIPLAIGGGAVAMVVLVVVLLAIPGGSTPETGPTARTNEPPKLPENPDPAKNNVDSGNQTTNGQPNNGQENVDDPPQRVDPPEGQSGNDPKGNTPPDPSDKQPGTEDVPKPKSTPGATLELATECDIGKLALQEQVAGFNNLVFRDLSKELLDLEYTHWHDQGLQIVSKVVSPGKCYIIVPEAFSANLSSVLKQLSFEKAAIECRIAPEGGGSNSSRCDVFEGAVPRGMGITFDMRNAPRWLILASEKIEFKPRGAMDVASLPDKSPHDPPRDPSGQPSGQPPKQPPVAVKRRPIPSNAEQQKILPDLEEAFELSNRNLSPEDKAKLSKSLIEEADNTKNDPVAQFVMLRKACEIAAGNCDLATALLAVDKIEQAFEADALAMQIKLIGVAAKAKATPDQKGKMVEQALPIIDEAMAADRFSDAAKITTSLVAVAVKVKNRSLSKNLAERRKLIVAAQREFKKVESALKTLKTSPDDPEANTVVGQYYCYVKDDWKEGLAMLTKGNDEPLKQLARQDLKNPKGSQDHLKLGDAWFQLAEAKDVSNDVRVGMQARAEQWYRRGLPSLSGLDKVKVEKRLDKIAETREKIGRKRKPKTIFPCKGQIIAACDYRLYIAVNGRQVIPNSSGSSSYGTPKTAMGVFNAGDIIIVRARRSSSARAFACVIKFEGTTRYIATGARNSGWMSYRPASSSSWSTPGQGAVLGPVVPARGAAAQRVFQHSGLQCAPIWGSYNESPTSSYGYTYMILQIK